MFQKKIFFLILFFFLSSKSISETVLKILASVNNQAITNIDIINEINILKILNKNIPADKINLRKIVLNNLIDQKIKFLEINNQTSLDKKEIENYYNILLNNLKIDENNINETNKKLIKEKIFIDTSWNKIISKTYGWKINVNINEINNKIETNKVININEKEKITEELINIEKNKKLQVFSNYHMNLLKNKYLIKYFQ